MKNAKTSKWISDEKGWFRLGIRCRSLLRMQTRPDAIPEKAARFYAAAVVLGLEYMQRHDLVWR